ncbi:MAG: RDD family protein [Dechloromonas sp.]|nr:RDD family protein [Dechloromonas sp.]
MLNNPASIGRRLASMLYESLTIFAVLLVGFLFPQIVLSGFGMALTGHALWIHLFLLLMGYFTWFWLHGGQTLPMKTWKLRVLDASGRPMRPLQAVLRYCAAWPSLLLFGAGLWWAFFDRDRLFLHDRIAGSTIIQDLTPLNPPHQTDGTEEK